MTDMYSELLIKKEPTGKDQALKVLIIALIVLTAAAGLFIIPLAWVLTIALGVAAYFILPLLDLEYEYVFVNGELDIDRIASKAKRKRVKSFKLSEADLVAPVNSHRMAYYNGNQRMKVLDYSSGNPEHKRFAVITRDGTDACKIIIEPDEPLAQAMKNSAPSKVFLD